MTSVSYHHTMSIFFSITINFKRIFITKNNNFNDKNYIYIITIINNFVERYTVILKMKKRTNFFFIFKFNLYTLMSLSYKQKGLTYLNIEIEIKTSVWIFYAKK